MIEISIYESDSYEPIAGVEVEIESDAVPSSTVTTDEWGYAYYYSEMPGNFTVTPRSSTYTFIPETSIVELTPDYPFASVNFEATSDFEHYYLYLNATSDGSPLGGIEFEVAPHGIADWLSIETEPDGWAVQEVPTSGDYDVRPGDNPGYTINPSFLTVTVDGTTPSDTIFFNVLPESINETTIPIEFSIDVYPNPFNSSCIVDSPTNSQVKIYNVMGEVVAEFSGGKHLWTPPRNLNSGLYHIVICDENQQFSRTVLYLR
jgi:hypothetical protein